MVATAKIQINNSKNAGNVGESSTDIQKEILEELKKGNELNKKTSSLSASGLLKSGGIIGATLFGIGAAVGSAFDSNSYPNTDRYGYSKVQTENGETMVAKIDQRNSKIVDLLTMQEATEQGILNDKNEIKDKVAVLPSVYNHLFEGLSKSKDAVMLSNEKLVEIADLETKEKEIQKDINRLKEEKRKNLGGTGNLMPTPATVNEIISSNIANLNPVAQQTYIDESSPTTIVLKKINEGIYGSYLSNFIKTK